MAGYSATYPTNYEAEGGVVVYCQGSSAGGSTVAGALTVGVTSASLTGSGLFEIYEGGSSGIAVLGGSGTAEALAQEIAETGSLSSVWLRLGKVGTPTDNVYVNVTSTLGGSALATSGLVSSASLPGPPGGTWTEFTFSSPIPITSATPIYIELERDGARDGSNWAYWVYDPQFANNPTPYARGVAWYLWSGVWGEVPSAGDSSIIDFQARLIFVPGGPRGRAKVTGDLIGNLIQLNTTVAGTSTVTGNLSGGGTYSAVGIATVTGSLTVGEFESLGGSIAGTGGVTGGLSNITGDYSAVGITTVAGTLDLPVAIGGTSGGESTVTAQLLVSSYQGQMLGVATVTGDLTLGVNNLPAPPVAGTSTVTGFLDFIVELSTIGCIRAGVSFNTSASYMGYFDGTDSNEGLAQRVWAAGGTVSFVTLQLWKVNSPTDNIRIRVRPILAQYPSVADSDWVDGSTLASSSPGADVTFTFPTAPVLSSDIPYFVELNRDGGRDETNYYEWAAATL